MSIVLWDETVYRKCPYCKHVVKQDLQESEGYGRYVGKLEKTRVKKESNI